ncbi:hypothetical protein GX48_04625 [Paracoccidioides brasiliensis]|nr:hypothetical protein GX48_04625 [Paracoccidioides brasiliensis]
MSNGNACGVSPDGRFACGWIHLHPDKRANGEALQTTPESRILLQYTKPFNKYSNSSAVYFISAPQVAEPLSHTGSRLLLADLSSVAQAI